MDVVSPTPTASVSGEDDEIIVLPWWKNPVNIVILALVSLFLAGAVGYSISSNTIAATEHNAVDTGFLQDMRLHHEQAVAISKIYRAAAPDGNSLLRTIADEIAFGQTQEVGRMIQILRTFGESETNQSDTVMTWMGHGVDLSMMPGMATMDELNLLGTLDGAKADEMFVRLMVAHHSSGVEMAQYAADNGKNDEVVALAKVIVEAQRYEIAELRRILPEAFAND